MCLGVSDGSLLPVFAHLLGAKKVLGFDHVGTSCTFTKQIAHSGSVADLSFCSLGLCLGLRFGKLQDV